MKISQLPLIVCLLFCILLFGCKRYLFTKNSPLPRGPVIYNILTPSSSNALKDVKLKLYRNQITFIRNNAELAALSLRPPFPPPPNPCLPGGHCHPSLFRLIDDRTAELVIKRPEMEQPKEMKLMIDIKEMSKELQQEINSQPNQSFELQQQIVR